MHHENMWGMFNQTIHKGMVDTLKKQGKAKNRPDCDFDPKELALGVKTEMEHVKDKEAAKEIAKDHLAENPNYYSKVLLPAEGGHMRKSKHRMYWLVKAVMSSGGPKHYGVGATADYGGRKYRKVGKNKWEESDKGSGNKAIRGAMTGGFGSGFGKSREIDYEVGISHAGFGKVVVFSPQEARNLLKAKKPRTKSGAMDWLMDLFKARSHKYIKKVGTGKTAKYTYRMPDHVKLDRDQPDAVAGGGPIKGRLSDKEDRAIQRKHDKMETDWKKREAVAYRDLSEEIAGNVKGAARSAAREWHRAGKTRPDHIQIGELWEKDANRISEMHGLEGDMHLADSAKGANLFVDIFDDELDRQRGAVPSKEAYVGPGSSALPKGSEARAKAYEEAKAELSARFKGRKKQPSG